MKKSIVSTVTDSISNLRHQIFKDDATYEKVHRHLSNINDQITDADIMNIKTEMVSTTNQTEWESVARHAGFR